MQDDGGVGRATRRRGAQAKAKQRPVARADVEEEANFGEQGRREPVSWGPAMETVGGRPAISRAMVQRETVEVVTSKVVRDRQARPARHVPGFFAAGASGTQGEREGREGGRPFILFKVFA